MDPVTASYTTAYQALMRFIELRTASDQPNINEAAVVARAALVDLREGMVTQRELIAALNDKVALLLVKTTEQKSYSEEGFYLFTDASGQTMGPFCGICFDNEGKKIRLRPTHRNDHRYHCDVCDKYTAFTGVHPEPQNTIDNSEYDPLARVRARRR